MARHADVGDPAGAPDPAGPTACAEVREPAPAGDLPLLVPHGREHGDPPGSRPPPAAAVRGKHRRRGAIPARVARRSVARSLGRVQGWRRQMPPWLALTGESPRILAWALAVIATSSLRAAGCGD